MGALETLDSYTVRTGWTDHSKLLLMARFIDQMCEPKDFGGFLEECAKEEESY